MRRAVRWILLIYYYSSLSMGLMPFTLNFKTGRCQKKMSVTAFCIIANILAIAIMPYIFHTMTFTSMSSGICQIFFGMITLVRVLATILIIVLNWKHLNKLLITLHGFVRLRQIYFCKFPISAKIQQKFEWNIIWKLTFGTASFFFMWVVAIISIWEVLNLQSFLSTTTMFLLTSVLDWVANHYYIGVIFVNTHFSILNDELQRILTKTESIQNFEKRHLRSGTFAELCCQLSDRLDQLAVIYNKLIKLTKNLNSLYQWQGAAICLTLYLCNIAMLFWIYTTLKSFEANLLGVSPFGLCMLSIAVVSFYLDLKYLICSIINMEDARNHSLSILRQQKCVRQLDIRLERSFDVITIQLSTQSLELNLCGLFTLDKGMVLSIFASTVTHSILLMLYDIENF